MQGTVCLVSCVSKKRNAPCEAQALYQSVWFQKARAYVEAKGMPWYILSAKYGLVRPDEVIAPYEQTLNKMPVMDRKAWAERVCSQLDGLINKEDRVVVLAGARYREFLMPTLARLAAGVQVPMTGMRIGQQLSWLGSRHGQA
jgi:cytoplasmic iron level regulating protein YaaA (DUF328/UPF0246 family)